MHGYNSLKCSVTPDFLLIDHFLYRLPTVYEKLKKICCGSFIFCQLFCQRIIEFRYYFSYTVLAKAHLKGWVQLKG